MLSINVSRDALPRGKLRKATQDRPQAMTKLEEGHFWQLVRAKQAEVPEKGKGLSWTRKAGCTGVGRGHQHMQRP